MPEGAWQILGSECLEGMELVEEWNASGLKEVAASRKELKNGC
jgi:hypothetical protein